MQNSELKECPFCGGTGTSIESVDSHSPLNRIVCKKCGWQLQEASIGEIHDLACRFNKRSDIEEVDYIKNQYGVRL